MSELEHLCNLLSATGLYDPQENTVVYAELAAYAEGLDLYFGELDELIKERFVSTAEDHGLTVRESMMRRMNFDTTLEGRRNALLSGLSVNTSDFTQNGMEKLLESFNVQGTLSYNADNKIISLTVPQSVSANDRARLEYEMKKLMPCWCGFEVTI